MAKKETKTNAVRILETMKIEYDGFIEGVHFLVAEEIDFKKVARVVEDGEFS